MIGRDEQAVALRVVARVDDDGEPLGQVGLEPVGHYAVKPLFSDGHDTGIFSWDYLYELGQHQDRLWADYLARLASAGLDRDAPMQNRQAREGGACAQ